MYVNSCNYNDFNNKSDHQSKCQIKDNEKEINLNINVNCNRTKNNPISTCPPVTPCPNLETMTTGPFHIPGNAEDARPNDRLVVTFKNPTNTNLSASLTVSACAPPTPTPPLQPIPTLFTFTTTETNVATLPAVSVPANSCTRIEFNIFAFRFGTLRVTAVGPFSVCECEPICGGLEITVAGGVGADAGGVAIPGLTVADPSLSFHYEDFVICDC